jgi:hypothetical protein
MLTAIAAVDITVNDGCESTLCTIPWSEGMTVIDATVQLRRQVGITVAYRGRGPSLFLLQLGNRLAQGPSGCNWIYTINGRLCNRSAGVQLLQAEDELEWCYAPWQVTARADEESLARCAKGEYRQIDR